MKYFYVGGYKGMTSLYNKRITPKFDTPEEALHYKQCYQVFSLSLTQGKLKSEKDEAKRMCK